MTRNHPLLILFLVASVTVDVVLIRLGAPRDVFKRALLSGLLFGQTGALALWAVWGKGHRLARVSWMVVTTCVIGFATGGYALLDTYQWLSILCIYTMIVYLGTLAIAGSRAYAARQNQDDESGPAWQVSLMELFGWTILVAIASFASRSMEFGFVNTTPYLAIRVAALVVLPLALAAGIRSELDDLTRSKIYWSFFVALLIAVTYLLRKFEPRTAVPFLLCQSGYMLAWLIVLGFDRVMRNVRSIEESLTDEARQTERESSQLDS